MKFALGLLVLLFLLSGCASTGPYKKPMVWLKNDKVELGVLAHVGGRAVSLKTPDGENVLKEVPERWKESESERPLPDISQKFVAYQGHIVWVGPQSEWWVHQDLAPRRKRKKAQWPPDPYTIYSKYAVVELSDNHVVLEGVPSPVWGVKMTKRYAITEEGQVKFSVTMTNTSDKPVSWDIWSNCRFPGEMKAYVPMEDASFRTLPRKKAEKKKLPVKFRDGFFTFNNKVPVSEDNPARREKAFINTPQAWLAAFSDDYLFIMKADKAPELSSIHPEQAVAEVYQSIEYNRENSLLELELHGPYSELMPGESKTHSETWYLKKLSRALSLREQTAYLKKAVKLPVYVPEKP